MQVDIEVGEEPVALGFDALHLLGGGSRFTVALGFDALHLLGGGSRFTTSSEIVGRCIAECGGWMRVYEHAGVPKCDTCGCVDEF